MADNMRPYTADAMKIEVAPWIQDYVVDMEDLFTELALEKIHNRVAWQDVKKLNHYKELFDEFDSDDRVDSHKREPLAIETSKKERHISELKQIKSKKILMKADPGMGKTTQCKKISWDWAMRLFTYFHIVFFVFLKLVKPGDVIENVIIKQNPYMKGLEITEQKVRSILQLLGGNCLLILDGLDEHALGTNEDVLSIIKGEKYLKCNIIVTSRPHSTRGIERYFPTVVRVEGFTKNKAKQFASKILSDERKIDDVLDFSPADFRLDVPIHKCPILLSFLCLLVREDEIDLSDKTIHVGEIYTRMVRCLYKKFTIRKGIEFKISEFIKVLKSIGKLALQTLLSVNPLLRRSQVIEEVGSDAFNYGLLIGNEDYHRLIRDETADIFVTFPHRTIQEFLGAFYLSLMLDDGQQMENILGRNDETKWIFMRNPLFLQICLWLLQYGEIYFFFQRSQDTYNQLIDFCVKKFNTEILDLKGIRASYPALNVKSAYDRNDIVHLNFLNKIFAKCDRSSRLVINYDDPLDWVLNSMALILNEVTYIGIGQYSDIDEIFFSYVSPTNIVFRISNSHFKELSTILEDCRTLVGKRSVSLYLDKAHSLSVNNAVNLKSLFVKSPGHELDLFLSYPVLTHLCLMDAQVKENTQRLFGDLSKAQSRGHFPLLSKLSLVNCTRVKSGVTILFQSIWPQLKHLNLMKSDLSETDLKVLCLASNSLVKTLPNLTSLFLSVPNEMTGETLSSNLFALPWVNLQRFYIDCLLAKSEIRDSLCDAIASEKLENLTSLVIQVRPGLTGDEQSFVKFSCMEKLRNLKSLCLRQAQSKIQIPIATILGITELGIYSCQSFQACISVFLSKKLQLLETLTLQKCSLNSQDLITLRQANLEDRLPNLKHLDLSQNEIVLSDSRHLFQDSCNWNQLLSLNVVHPFYLRWMHEVDKVLGDLNSVVGRGGFSSLQRLGINYYNNTNIVWPQLEKIHVMHCDANILKNIIEIRSNFLPQLHTLCIAHCGPQDARLARKLSEIGVSFHEFYAPWDDPFRKCHCEET